MRIARAAQEIGVPAHRLRHYESVGLVVPDRTETGYRDYSSAQIERARQVKSLFVMGFTAKDAMLMLPCMTEEPAPNPECAATRQRMKRRLRELTARRRQLETTESALADWLGH